MAATQRVQAHRCGEANLLKFTASIRTEKREGICLPSSTFRGFTENDPEKRKCPARGSRVEENASLVSGLRGQNGQTLAGDHRIATGTQITTGYNQGPENSICEGTTPPTVKQRGSIRSSSGPIAPHTKFVKMHLMCESMLVFFSC